MKDWYYAITFWHVLGAEQGHLCMCSTDRSTDTMTPSRRKDQLQNG